MKIRAIFHVLAAMAVLGACFSPSVVQAQNCHDFTNYLGWRTRLMTPPGQYAPSVNGVTVVGDLAYVAASSAGLAIYNVVDQANPVLLGVADTPQTCLNVAVDGNYAYVTDWWGPGFCVVDVSDPAAPEVVGTAGGTPNPFYVNVAVVKPDTVFVIDNHYGVRMVDVSDPTDPEIYGGIEVPGGYLWNLDVEGNTLYFCDRYDGLFIYDVTICEHPEKIGFVPLPVGSYDVDVVGDLAYVACGESGLQIVNVHDPENPQYLGSLGVVDPLSIFFDIQVVGDLAYMLRANSIHGNEGVVIANVAYPTAPYLVNTLTVDSDIVYDLCVSGDHLYLGATDKGLLVADVSNIASPAFTSSYVEQDFLPRAVAAAGNYAYVLDSYFGLRVMDITTTPYPTLLSTVDLPGGAFQVVLDGSLAYVADDAGGLQIVDVADPAAAEIIGSILPFGNQVDVDIQGNHAYLASPTMGLQIVDVTDPTNPVQRGTVNPPGSNTAVAVDGDYAYVASQYDGLQVVNITNPNAPTVAGALDFDGWPNNVHLARGHAFVSAAEHGVYVVDLTNPTVPELVSTLVTPGQAFSVVVDGDLAYIADYFGGLFIADITDLANPHYLGSVDTPGHRALDIALAGDRICIPDWEGGFHVLWKHCVPSGVPGGEIPSSPLSLTAYPNPFNPRTTLSFTLGQSEATRITVFTLDGRPVRSLTDRVFSPGPNTISWNGLDDRGRRLPSGSYLIRMETASGVQKSKVTLLK
jgi:hypothetical protein